MRREKDNQKESDAELFLEVFESMWNEPEIESGNKPKEFKGGGYKLVELHSLLFTNRDPKLGHDIDFETWRRIQFPQNTKCKLSPSSKSRYYHHEYNAGPMLVRREKYSGFLKYLKEKKVT